MPGDRTQTIRLCSTNERLSVMYRQCGKCNIENHLRNLTIYVNDKHKVIGCLIPKTACSSWKLAMIKASGMIDMTEVDHFRHIHNHTFMGTIGWRLISTYSEAGIRRRLRTYFKFMTVRHPFDRLVSAYKDKIVALSDSYEDGLHEQRIKLWYRDVNLETGGERRGQVTFAEFVRYVLDTKPENMDRHWRDYSRLCDPCRVHYDYVVRMETLRSDSKAILPLFSTDDTLPMENIRQTAEPYSLQHGKNVSLVGSIPANDIRRLLRLYRRDFEMFGYTWRQSESVAMCANAINGSLCC